MRRQCTNLLSVGSQTKNHGLSRQIWKEAETVSVANMVKAFVVCVQQMDLFKRLGTGADLFSLSLVLVLNSISICP